MALIKCPECGRVVSTDAEMCLGCGYGIKEHFEKVRVEKQKQEEHEWRLQNVKMPEEPQRKNFFLGFGKFCFIFSAIFIVFSIVLDSFELMGSIVLMAVIGAWFWYEGVKQYNKQLQKYNLAILDFEKYQKEVVRKEEQRAREEALKPKCPLCGSKNLVKISTADRVVSVGMVGVASGKIGKQYKCKNCKHMW